MKLVSSLLFVCALAIGAAAQTLPDNVYASGLSFNSSASARFAGTGLYARKVSDGSGTYFFTAVDALPASVRPFTVSTNFGAGVAQKLPFTLGKIPFYAPVGAGFSYNGTNKGWEWNGGILASIRLKGNWHLYPNARFLKSSISAGSGYQPIVGVLIGWQQ